MNLAGILKDMAKECGLDPHCTLTPDLLAMGTPRGKRRHKEVIFLNVKRPHTKSIDHYRITVADKTVIMSRAWLESKTVKGQNYTIPKHVKLLSVDICDPRSLTAIRDWLESLR